MAQLLPQNQWETMAGEYSTLGLYPQGHVMAFLRSSLPRYVMNSESILELSEGAEVTVAGLVIRRQRPHAKAVFITLEDEFGHIPLVLWPDVYQKFRLLIREPLLVMSGVVSRREDTFNIVAKEVRHIKMLEQNLPRSKDWQ